MEFSFVLLIISFIAGVITVFAPCVFTFLPVILVGSYGEKKNYRRAFIVTASLVVSVIVFTLLLRVSTSLIQVPLSFWDLLAGTIILLQGIFLLRPAIWEVVSGWFGFSRSSSLLKEDSSAVLTGMALGPIFSSCSPTYGYIIAVVIQSSFSVGIIYLLTYVFGLCLVLFLISILGNKFIKNLKWGTNPDGAFKKTLAVILIVLGIFIMTGFYKKVETYIIQSLPFLDATRIDREILRQNV